MMAMIPVLIHTEHRRFAEALADLLPHELGCQVTMLQEAPVAGGQEAFLLTTEEIPEHWHGPVLRLALSSPCRLTVLLAQMEQRLNDPHVHRFALSPYLSLDPRSKRLETTDEGRHAVGVVELTEKECALLLYVWRKNGEEVSREEILKAVWGMGEGVNSATLETHLYRLRQKWREIADYDCIQATDGGYRFHVES